MKTTYIQKNLRFSQQVVEVLEPKAARLGMSFNDYVRYKILKDAEEEVKNIDLSENALTLKAINKTRSAIKRGDFKVLKTEEDIDDLLNSVFDDEE